jgi:hypothetical protein
VAVSLEQRIVFSERPRRSIRAQEDVHNYCRATGERSAVTMRHAENLFLESFQDVERAGAWSIASFKRLRGCGLSGDNNQGQRIQTLQKI